MLITIISLFCIGYLLIIFENLIEINKTALALVTGVLCWIIFALFSQNVEQVNEQLFHHLGKSAEILFFLLGAMTIVEIIDAHQGFSILTSKIKTNNCQALLLIIAFTSFFLSAILDNLTTAIVMASLLRKIITDKQQRKIFVSVVIIAANAGGVSSPIGDITTTMLWVGGQISAINTIKSLFLPSLVSLLVPLIWFLRQFKGQTITFSLDDKFDTSKIERNIMFFSGLGVLLAVPIIKTITHLPPYMAVLLGLGIVWVIGEVVHKEKDEQDRKPFSVAHALSKIDTSSILFFLGILLAIGVLESTHLLRDLANQLQAFIPNQNLIVLLIGFASAIVDNVPLVAATIGMYDINVYPIDSSLWQFLAYCAGTGGSMLIIGSAAGVAVMGIEKIDFIWYLKNISLLVFCGYLAGAAVYVLL